MMHSSVEAFMDRRFRSRLVRVVPDRHTTLGSDRDRREEAEVQGGVCWFGGVDLPRRQVLGLSSRRLTRVRASAFRGSGEVSAFLRGRPPGSPYRTYATREPIGRAAYDGTDWRAYRVALTRELAASLKDAEGAAERLQSHVGLAPVPKREAAPANTAEPHGKESAPDSSKAAK